MLIAGQKLDDWFLHEDRTKTPGCGEYQIRYTGLLTYLKREVYPYIASAARLSDGKGFLTDHGEEHVATVIARASDVLRNEKISLDWYETYILLVSILFHDVGNIYGRRDHEKRAIDVMRDVGNLLGVETVEKRQIRAIAEAHGGFIKNDRDTISFLPRYEMVLNRKIRPQFLAALLRFADELSDEHTRAARYLLAKGVLPESSEIYHKYADALHTVHVVGNTIELYFELGKDSVLQPYGKENLHAYLFDEINTRVRKMHYERVYCMRFLRPMINLERLSVDIRIYTDLWEEIRRYSYVLHEDGYPNTDRHPAMTFSILQAPGSGVLPTGAALAEELNQGGGPNAS